MIDKNNLSTEAQRLIELTSYPKRSISAGEPNPEIDVTTILQEHPELVAGLNEYIKWRDDAMRLIAKQSETPSFGHGTSTVLQGMKKPLQ